MSVPGKEESGALDTGAQKGVPEVADDEMSKSRTEWSINQRINGKANTQVSYVITNGQ